MVKERYSFSSAAPLMRQLHRQSCANRRSSWEGWEAPAYRGCPLELGHDAILIAQPISLLSYSLQICAFSTMFGFVIAFTFYLVLGRDLPFGRCLRSENSVIGNLLSDGHLLSGSGIDSHISPCGTEVGWSFMRGFMSFFLLGCLTV